ncbi:MAG TPA: hypothetical protein VHC20_04040 [Candidatus Paceibacterota bacterium]|nr:hypothetical protein [Candidatus Paceibacterota bacterium]
MSKETTLIIVGVLVVLSPFLGLPESWLSVILPALGAVILVMGYLAIQRRRESPEA